MADDQGILGANGQPNLTPVNSDAYTFPRSPAQVCCPALYAHIGMICCDIHAFDRRVSTTSDAGSRSSHLRSVLPRHLVCESGDQRWCIGSS